MNCIEVIGGVKQEPILIKIEPPETDENVVEISSADINDPPEDNLKEDQALNELKGVPKKEIVKNEGETVCVKQEQPKVEALDKIKIQSKSDKNKVKNEEKEVLLMNFTGGGSPSRLYRERYEYGSSSKILPHEIIIKGSCSFVCYHCKKTMGNKKNMSRHIRIHHREDVKMHQCPHCPYQSKYNIRTHLISLHTDLDQIEWFYCGRCDYKCKLKPQLQRHNMYKHTDEISYNQIIKCNQCDKQFKTWSTVRKHEKYVHTKSKEKPFSCEFCEYSARLNVQVKNHKKLYHTDLNDLEELKCGQCSFTTKLLRKYHAHLFIHKEKLQCHICAYQAKDKGKLHLHLISHQKEKKEEDLKFKCTECSYKTYRVYNLTIHQMKHKKPEEIQLFECFHCGFRANRKDNLKAHIGRHNKKNEIVLKCFICDFQTTSKSILNNHIDKHSKNDS